MKSQTDEADDMEDLATLEVLDEVGFLFLWHVYTWTNHTKVFVHTVCSTLIQLYKSSKGSQCV